MAESTFDLDFNGGQKNGAILKTGSVTQPESRTIDDSDEIFEMVCETCMRDGIHRTACAFCGSCIAYYCSTCLKHHGKFFRKHSYVVGDDVYSDKCFEKCKTHTKEIVKFYCYTCRNFVCTICKEDLHTDACCLKYLPELLKDQNFGKEINLIHSHYKTLTDKLSDTQETFATNHEHLSKIATETRCVIKQEKENIFEKFDKEANEIENKIQTTKEQECKVIHSLKDTHDHLALEMDKLSRNTSDLTSTPENKKYKIFIDLKQISEQIKQEEDSIDKICPCSPEFHLEDRAKHLCKEVKAFGSLLQRSISLEVQNEAKTKQKRNAHALDDIYVKADGDEKVCHIIDCCMISEQYLVLCDKNNCSLKLIDVQLNIPVLVHRKLVSLAPEAVTKIDNNQLAFVHAYDEDEKRSEIKFLTLTDRKKLVFQKKPILTEMFCYAIACIKNDKLMISMFLDNEGKVQLLDMDGRTLIDIKTNSDGVSMFRNPCCLTIDTKGKYAYVSDWYRDEIIKIDLDSYETKVVAYMWHPESITIDEEGFVYVVEIGTNELFYLHPHCEYSEKVILLHTLPGDWEPFGICFNSAGRKLYVGQAERDTIKVFKVDE